MNKKLLALLGMSSLLSVTAVTLLGAESRAPESPATVVKPESIKTSLSTNETVVCQDLLEQDENATLAAEYGKLAVADCMFVGCGGTF